MGKFTNTETVNTVNSLVEGYKDRLHNSFHPNFSKGKIVVTYLTINHEASNIDESTGLVEDNIGIESPIRYNKINNFIVFSDDFLLTTSVAETEFGPECDAFTGRSNIAPNTISPTIGDQIGRAHV